MCKKSKVLLVSCGTIRKCTIVCNLYVFCKRIVKYSSFSQPTATIVFQSKLTPLVCLNGYNQRPLKFFFRTRLERCPPPTNRLFENMKKKKVIFKKTSISALEGPTTENQIRSCNIADSQYYFFHTDYTTGCDPQ